MIGVDALPQLPFAAKVDALPVALHGALTGSAVLETTFTGKAGQKVTVEVEAQRLGGKLRPVFTSTTRRNSNSRGRGVRRRSTATRDSTATLPADGTYTVSAARRGVRGPRTGVLPPEDRRSSTTRSRCSRRSSTKDTKSVELLGSTSAKADLPAAHGAVIPLDWPKAGTWSGPRPFVQVSSRPEFVEPTTAGKPLDLPGGRVGVCGKLGTTGEEDKYRVAVTPNTKVRFEVFAERIGSPVDAALVIRNDAGAVLAQAEDSPGTLDPGAGIHRAGQGDRGRGRAWSMRRGAAGRAASTGSPSIR